MTTPDPYHRLSEEWLTSSPELPAISPPPPMRSSLPDEVLAWLTCETARQWDASASSDHCSDAWRRAARRAIPRAWVICESGEPTALLTQHFASGRYACGWWDDHERRWRWGGLIWDDPHDWSTWMQVPRLGRGIDAHPLIRSCYDQGVALGQTSALAGDEGNALRPIDATRLAILNRLLALRLALGDAPVAAVRRVARDMGLRQRGDGHPAPSGAVRWWMLDPVRRQVVGARCDGSQVRYAAPDPSDLSWKAWAATQSR